MKTRLNVKVLPLYAAGSSEYELILTALLFPGRHHRPSKRHARPIWLVCPKMLMNTTSQHRC